MRFTLPLLARRLRPPVAPPEIKVSELTKKYANLPEKYIEDATRGVTYRTPRGINYRPKEQRTFKNYVGLERPWAFESENEKEDINYSPFVEPLRHWFFFKGDRVQVLVGKDAGKQGLVELVIPERNWVIVGGLNGEVESNKDEDGYIYSYAYTERPLLVPSQVALVDPGDLLPTEVEWGYTETGDKVRVSVRTGRIIPLSKKTEETHQYKSPANYVENEKDTTAANMKVTFKPRLTTFEMEIAEELGITEDRIPKKTYWY
ncbi:probable 39S ribosomal protein L24, mitochondrial [Thrips palmi]|uniref:Large ribosomal subunit protein uL24m n=1 Tax=Thrips palmi TaxID=161013 RepID=A0A6P8ZM28_THRPL|nr:probable 39S ribosomal protein L24, mitochondrial [Thrips palmi]